MKWCFVKEFRNNVDSEETIFWDSFFRVETLFAIKTGLRKETKKAKEEICLTQAQHKYIFNSK